MKSGIFAAAGVALALAVPATAQAATKPAKEFLGDAIRGDNSEVTLGTLAAQKGNSAAVRSYGRTLATDHAKAKISATSAAKLKGVSVPKGMMPEAQAEYDKLKGMSGAAFDAEFVRYMTEDHKKDIAEFEEQSGSTDMVTSRLAKRTLPDLRKHLQMAQKLS